MKNLEYKNLVPSIGGSFGYGWRKMFEKSFLPLLLAVIIVGILSGPVKGSWQADEFAWSQLVFLFPILLFGLAYGFLFLPINYWCSVNKDSGNK